MNSNHQSPITNYRLGLIGYPLGHSLSPKIHAAALKACGLQGDYSLFPIHPDNQRELKDLIARVRAGELHGLNVTIPHKQNVIPLLNELTPTAKSIGAVNTIYLRGDKLIGDNTDAPGFLSDLKKLLANRKLVLSEVEASSIVNRKSSIVLGAGGAARAVISALLSENWQITLAVRAEDTNQAKGLIASFNHANLKNFILLTTEGLSALTQIDLIVNTTPLGMSPAVDTCPLPADYHFPVNAALYDCVYNPRETLLAKRARAAGLPAETGLGMLIEQAALAFEKWTGHNPPRDVLYNSVVE